MAAPRPLDVAEAARVAALAAQAGGAAALRHWRGTYEVETKPDGSRVTVADREAEVAILAVLREHYPEHAVLAEESGASGAEGAPRWIVDPVDGTHGFTRGGESWGPLVALEVDGVMVAGALDAWATPIDMKRSRPAVMIAALVEPNDVDSIGAVLLKESGSLGYRASGVARRSVARRLGEVTIDGHTIAIKESEHTAKAEYLDVAKAAESLGRPARTVAAEAEDAWRRTVDGDD